jgi:hypothetical protein
MSTLKTNNVQVGQSVTATNNFTIYQPSSPDGTVRIGVGNSGATTGDAVTINSTGIVKGAIVSGTAVASTSGTSVDFTGIPSTAKRITVMFSGVSTSGTSLIQIQIGAGSVDATSYTSSAGSISNALSTSTTGFVLTQTVAAVNTYNGVMTINLLNPSTNLWVEGGVLLQQGGNGFISAGNKTLSGTLDRVRITTVNGTDTFDAGTINIMWEG